MRKKINIYWGIKSSITAFFVKQWRLLIIIICIFLIADFYWTTSLVEKKEITININSSFVKNAHLNIICTINNSLNEYEPKNNYPYYEQVPYKKSDWIELDFDGIIPHKENIPDTINLIDYYYFKYYHYDSLLYKEDSIFFVSDYYNKSYIDPIVYIDLQSEQLNEAYLMKQPYPFREWIKLSSHESGKIDNQTDFYLNKYNNHHWIIKNTDNAFSFKYFAKPINKTQVDSVFKVQLVYEGSFFQNEIKRLTKYIYTQIKIKFKNIPEKYYKDSHGEWDGLDFDDYKYKSLNLRRMSFIIKYTDLPLPDLNITPEPDVINTTYLEYNSYEKCNQILNSGIIIYAENLHYKSFINNLDFILATILGALISILVEVIIRRTYKNSP